MAGHLGTSPASRILTAVEQLFQDVRHGLRSLWRAPGFAVVAVLTLALGIGVNTLVFSLVSPVVLQSLPYKDPGQLVVLLHRSTTGANETSAVSPQIFQEWRSAARSFDDLSALRGVGGTALLSGTSFTPQLINVAMASANFFPMLGINPRIGRLLQSSDEQISALAFSGSICVISDALWHRAFQADPQAIGRHLQLNGRASTVVGVLPATFEFRVPYDLFVPLPAPGAMQQESAYVPVLTLYGRLKPGVTVAQAAQEMDALAARDAQADPVRNKNWSVLISPLQDFYLERAHTRTALLLVFGLAGLVLLICVVNLANLALARGASRSRERAVRLALGASSWRVMRQELIESLLISLGGGALGVALAAWSIPLLRELLPAFPSFRPEAFSVNWRVFAFALGAATFAGILFGFAPALRATNADAFPALKSGGRSLAGAGKGATRGLLVVAEFALSLIVVASAALFGRTLVNLQAVNPGFDAAHVLTMRLYLQQVKYPRESDVTSFFKRLDARLAAVPGITATSLSISPPLSGLFVSTDVTPEGNIPGFPGSSAIAVTTTATPGYFRALGMRIVSGRSFEDRDMALGAPRSVVISASLASRLWPGGSAVGRRVRTGRNESAPLETIVGVAPDVHHAGLGSGPDLEIYEPVYRESLWEPRTLIVSTAGDPRAMIAAVRQIVSAIDPDQPLDHIESADAMLATSLSRERFSAIALAAFGALALALAGIGIYGVMSCLAAQRVREIGVRLALGASPWQILSMMGVHGLRLAGCGVLVGIAGAVALNRIVWNLLFGVGRFDLPTFVLVPVLLLAVAVLACLAPARRAMRVEPIVALRSE